MIPQTRQLNQEISTERMPSKTYRIDYQTNRVRGVTDGLEAIEQAIYKILITERYEYLIYSFNYGVEFEALIGKDYLFIKADLKRRIEDALLQDDRIERIENLKIVHGTEKDQLVIKFDAITVEGVLNIESGVRK